ncbi:MAG: hypothetical protein LBG88_02020 [Christensenellaceae bacterium]|jgi:hypothetical protein|nr:hypothetical protein [Christensenellaceae bacterium]
MTQKNEFVIQKPTRVETPLLSQYEMDRWKKDGRKTGPKLTMDQATEVIKNAIKQGKNPVIVREEEVK